MTPPPPPPTYPPTIGQTEPATEPEWWRRNGPWSQGSASKPAPAPAAPVFTTPPVDMTKPQLAPAPAALPVPPKPPTVWTTPRGARVKVNLRQAAYWGSAIGAAWFLRMPQLCRDLYVWGHADPVGVAVLAIESAVGIGTWFALPYTATVLPPLVLKARALVALLAAAPAWYLRPQLAAAMAPWGIWPSTVAPLAVALLVNVGCWWLARRYRHWHPSGRWVIHMPMAASVFGLIITTF